MMEGVKKAERENSLKIWITKHTYLSLPQNGDKSMFLKA